MSAGSAATLISLATVLFLRVRPGLQLDIGRCQGKLGLEDGSLPDSSLTASSSYDKASVGPQNARLNRESGGGAWCPAKTVSRDTPPEYLEVDLGTLHVVTRILSQGRFGNGRGQEFSERFKLQYWRPGLADFLDYRDGLGNKVLSGNSDTFSVADNSLNPEVFASKVRILPYSDHPRTVCMRLELVGCAFLEGVLAYSIPQGMVRGAMLELMDHTYDGHEDSVSGDLRGGLGQLVDGHYGLDDFKASGRVGLKGFEWVGWKRKANNSPLTMEFKFDCVRKFDRVTIHVTNHFTRDTQVFNEARIYFTNEEDKFGDDRSVKFSYVPDMRMENARNVTINLKGNRGRFVRLQLAFSSKWLMISEVTFVSEPIQEKLFDAPSDVVPFNIDKGHSPKSSFESQQEGAADQDPAVDIHINLSGAEDELWESQPVDGRMLGVIIGALVSTIGLLSVGIVLLMYNAKRCGQTIKSRPCTLESSTVDVGDGHGSILTRGLLAGKFTGHSSALFHRNSAMVRVKGWTWNRMESSSKPCDERGTTLATLKMSQRRDNFDGIYDEPVHTDLPEEMSFSSTQKVGQNAWIPPLSEHGSGRNRGVKPRLAELESQVHQTEWPYCTELYPNKSIKEPATGLYATPFNFEKDAFKSSKHIKTDDEVQKYSSQSSHTEQQSVHDDVVAPASRRNCCRSQPKATEQPSGIEDLKRIPRRSLKMLKKLGEGRFGEIHLCAIDLENVALNRVAMKILRKGCDEALRADFENEARILSGLNDPNLVHVIGVCVEGEVVGMVCEYTDLGDLHQYLRSHAAETSLVKSARGYGCLIHMAAQVASGMKYLESLSFVHRDLAARNCLVGSSGKSIKISDFGMSRYLYHNDYFQSQTGSLLPIRWMAWESALLGKFTSKSDVWSFGVLLWEILTFARQRPYESSTEEEVIASLSNMYATGEASLTLPIPQQCPREVWDLMQECWHPDEKERPPFSEIHLFLQRKNLGYCVDKDSPRSNIGTDVIVVAGLGGDDRSTLSAASVKGQDLTKGLL